MLVNNLTNGEKVPLLEPKPQNWFLMQLFELWVMDCSDKTYDGFLDFLGWNAKTIIPRPNLPLFYYQPLCLQTEVFKPDPC